MQLFIQIKENLSFFLARPNGEKGKEKSVTYLSHLELKDKNFYADLDFSRLLIESIQDKLKKYISRKKIGFIHILLSNKDYVEINYRKELAVFFKKKLNVKKVSFHSDSTHYLGRIILEKTNSQRILIANCLLNHIHLQVLEKKAIKKYQIINEDYIELGSEKSIMKTFFESNSIDKDEFTIFQSMKKYLIENRKGFDDLYESARIDEEVKLFDFSDIFPTNLSMVENISIDKVQRGLKNVFIPLAQFFQKNEVDKVFFLSSIPMMDMIKDEILDLDSKNLEFESTLIEDTNQICHLIRCIEENLLLSNNSNLENITFEFNYLDENMEYTIPIGSFNEPPSNSDSDVFRLNLDKPKMNLRLSEDRNVSLDFEDIISDKEPDYEDETGSYKFIKIRSYRDSIGNIYISFQGMAGKEEFQLICNHN